MADDLPSYFDDPEPEPGRVERPAAVAAPPRPRLAVDLVPLAAAMRPPTWTTVVVQVVGIRPDVARRRLASWATEARRTGAAWRAGRDRLVVAGDRAATPDRSCCDGHVRVEVRRRGRPPLALEVGCAPWSSTRVELHVVPARTVRDRRRYFRAAHTVLDRLARDLR